MVRLNDSYWSGTLEGTVTFKGYSYSQVLSLF